MRQVGAEDGNNKHHFVTGVGCLSPDVVWESQNFNPEPQCLSSPNQVFLFCT